jgi:hypothetical protein
MRGLVASCIALGLVACKADIPSGAFSCDVDSECPSGFVCRARSANSERLCFAEGEAPDGGHIGADFDGGATRDSSVSNSGSDGGETRADAGTDGTIDPAFEVRGAGFWSGGDARSAGRYAVHDEGFDRGERLCTTDRDLCVTGGFSP